MGSIPSILTGCVFLYIILSKLLPKQWGKQRTNLPPSPAGLPLIGHLHVMWVKRGLILLGCCYSNQIVGLVRRAL
jgi:hypothetical protein